MGLDDNGLLWLFSKWTKKTTTKNKEKRKDKCFEFISFLSLHFFSIFNFLLRSFFLRVWARNGLTLNNTENMYFIYFSDESCQSSVLIIWTSTIVYLLNSTGFLSQLSWVITYGTVKNNTYQKEEWKKKLLVRFQLIFFCLSKVWVSI